MTAPSPVPRRGLRERGFTILELLVGLTVAAIVLTAVVSLFTETMRTQHRQRSRAELARQGAFLGHMLTQELRVIGLGVPMSVSVDGNLAPPVPVLFAHGQAIGFVADLPRPDATFNTFGFLDDRPAGFERVMWHTDNNGSCAPQLGGACTITETSALYRGDNNACEDAGDRTCPWSNHRLRPGEFFQLVAGNGTWANLKSTGSGQSSGGFAMTVASNPDGRDVRGITIDSAKSASQAIGWPAAWTNVTVGDAPVDVRGQGFVTTLDRVFYRFCNGACGGGSGQTNVLERRQCWGPVVSNDVSWPTTSATTNGAALIDGSFDPTSVPSATCTPWEIAARDVQSVSFTYFRARTGTGTGPTNDNTFRLTSAELLRSAQPRVATELGRVDIAQIRFDIQLQRSSENQIVRHDVVGTVRLRNR